MFDIQGYIDMARDYIQQAKGYNLTEYIDKMNDLNAQASDLMLSGGDKVYKFIYDNFPVKM